MVLCQRSTGHQTTTSVYDLVSGVAQQLYNHPSTISAVRVEHLSDAARSNQHALNKTQEEIGEYRRQLQSRTIELETLRGTKESLERQRVEYEERNHDELNSLQVGNHQNAYISFMGGNVKVTCILYENQIFLQRYMSCKTFYRKLSISWTMS